jgi:hypothetical protein
MYVDCNKVSVIDLTSLHIVLLEKHTRYVHRVMYAVHFFNERRLFFSRALYNN